MVLASEENRITLAWDANTESNLAGYNVYVGRSPGGPYELIGTNDADNIEFTWYDLLDNLDYYFVVTAFNDEELESGYSNEICGYTDENHEQGIACEADYYTDEPVSGSGGRGCFINTIN